MHTSLSGYKYLSVSWYDKLLDTEHANPIKCIK